jgi:hypothetical protein
MFLSRWRAGFLAALRDGTSCPAPAPSAAAGDEELFVDMAPMLPILATLATTLRTR